MAGVGDKCERVCKGVPCGGTFLSDGEDIKCSLCGRPPKYLRKMNVSLKPAEEDRKVPPKKEEEPGIEAPNKDKVKHWENPCDKCLIKAEYEGFKEGMRLIISLRRALQ